MILEALRAVALNRASLSREESRLIMADILRGAATSVQLAALLAALKTKGETVEEIVGFTEAIRMVAPSIPLLEKGESAATPDNNPVVDTCGTGGDGGQTFNISTASAFVVAGARVPVAKHGNRNVSSRCGSADVMEALGVRIDLPPEAVAQCLRATGIAFLFAPSPHVALRPVQLVRREMNMRTIFNLLGPLTNPMRPTAQVIGVYAPELVEKLARSLIMLGTKRGFVVHGHDGLDEITITGPTQIAEVRGEWVRFYEITPEDFGLPMAPLASISGGDAGENARIIESILDGEKSSRRDIVVLNSAAALVAAGRSETIADAISIASKSLDSGAARAKLNSLIEFTNGPLTGTPNSPALRQEAGSATMSSVP